MFHSSWWNISPNPSICSSFRICLWIKLALVNSLTLSWFCDQQRAAFGLTAKILLVLSSFSLFICFPAWNPPLPVKQAHFSTPPASMCCSNSFPRWRLNRRASHPVAPKQSGTRLHYLSPGRELQQATRSISKCTTHRAFVLLAADRQTYYSLTSTLRHQMYREKEGGKKNTLRVKWSLMVAFQVCLVHWQWY